jgi:hypothetical protein
MREGDMITSNQNDVSALKGCQILQISVGEFELQISFTADIAISIESEIILEGKNLSGLSAGQAIVPFVGEIVKDVQFIGESDLKLLFVSGKSVILQARPKGDGFESYSISLPSGTIVI